MLETAGSSLENAVKVNIFITSMANFGPMNDVYAQFFNTDVKPVCFLFSPSVQYLLLLVSNVRGGQGVARRGRC